MSRRRSSGQSAQCEYGKKCTPGTTFATGALVATIPVTAIAAWVVPWNPPENATTSPRPVAVLQSFSAASTALAPVGPQKCTRIRSRIPSGSIDSCAVVNASLAGEGRSSPWQNRPSCAAATSTSSG